MSKPRLPTAATRSTPNKPYSGYFNDSYDKNKAMEDSNNNPKKRRQQLENDWAEIVSAKPSVSEKAVMDGRAELAKASTRSPARNSTTKPHTPGTSPNKRRPYRRTKRPPNYNDKSTITTCTPTAVKAAQQSNVYDAVLGEAEDLLKAAYEAQALGRLKIASNYCLLLHARLVGLGKKFDRAKQTEQLAKDREDNTNKNNDNDSTLRPVRLNMDEGNTDASANNNNGSGEAPNNNNDDHEPPEPPETPRPYVPPSNMISEAALNQLSNYLPSNIQMDQAMVEHLARAAVELHQKRTGKKPDEEGLLNSPAMNTEDVLHYNRGPSYYSDDNPRPKNLKSDTWAATPRPVHQPNSSRGVAWSQSEQQLFNIAITEVGCGDVGKIAKLMGNTKTHAQIKAYIRNQFQMDSSAAIIENDLNEDGTPRRRGGRGRKPPTTAMNTVPNQNFDAKSMLHGVKHVI